MPQKLSIITINRNNAEGLDQTLKSVINQTFRDYEFIVIDGASADESLDIINNYSESITYWTSEPDNGIYHAMNKGISKATGEYCLFLNSGDHFVSDTILSDVFRKNPDSDIIYGDLYLQNSNGRRIQKFPEKLSFFWLYSEFLGHASTLIKRKLFSAIGLYNEGYKIVSDWEFILLCIAKHNCSSLHLPFPVSVLTEGGISNDKKFKQLVLQERDQVLKTHFPLFIDDYLWMYNKRYNHPFKMSKRFIKKLIFYLINK